MINVNKIYKKAMDSYCDGKLDKALSYCDKILRLDRSHSPTLNLKGLIYYVRGDLEEARGVWKLSYKLNGDMVSKKYIEDSRQDEGDIYIFSQGVHLFNEVKIREALKCFLKCESSHFNSVNLWRYIAKCYMQLGQHNKAVKYVEDVLAIDRHNVEAIKLKKQLIELGFIPKDTGAKCKRVILISGISIVTICIILLIGFGAVKGYNKVQQWLQSNVEAKKEESSKDETNLDNFQGNSQKSEENTVNDTEETQDEGEKDKNKDLKDENEVFDANKLKSYIAAKDYKNIIGYIEKYDVGALNINNKTIIQNATNLIKEDGVLALYELGTNYMKDKKYDSAINTFNMIYKYSEGIYLNEHILFMMAGSYENLGDIESANKYYEIYVDKYLKEGSYIEQCLYSLATNNYGIDNEKAKKYAEILHNEFNKSEFNNSKIEKILK
ncbi:MAG: tetratricopeptide repeat protein [Clostridium sp.]